MDKILTSLIDIKLNVMDLQDRLRGCDNVNVFLTWLTRNYKERETTYLEFVAVKKAKTTQLIILLLILLLM